MRQAAGPPPMIQGLRKPFQSLSAALRGTPRRFACSVGRCAWVAVTPGGTVKLAGVPRPIHAGALCTEASVANHALCLAGDAAAGKESQSAPVAIRAPLMSGAPPVAPAASAASAPAGPAPSRASSRASGLPTATARAEAKACRHGNGDYANC